LQSETVGQTLIAPFVAFPLRLPHLRNLLIYNALFRRRY
jgi:hypothetical protein